MPEDDSHGHGYVERMLGSELGDLEGKVRGIDYILTDTVHLISEYKGVFRSGFRTEYVQFL